MDSKLEAGLRNLQRGVLMIGRDGSLCSGRLTHYDAETDSYIVALDEFRKRITARAVNGDTVIIPIYPQTGARHYPYTERPDYQFQFLYTDEAAQVGNLYELRNQPVPPELVADATASEPAGSNAPAAKAEPLEGNTDKDGKLSRKEERLQKKKEREGGD